MGLIILTLLGLKYLPGWVKLVWLFHYLMRQFNSAFVGRYVSKEEFAREMVSMEHELSEFAERYFDYDKYADELFDEGYWFESGYVFRDE